MISACQKEEMPTNKKELLTKKLAINPLAEIQPLIPENVEVIPRTETFLRKKDGPNSFPISTIDLTDCGEQPCYQVIPSNLNKMQRMADQFCRPVYLNICCCAKGEEWCYQFKIKPRFTCSQVTEIKQLLPEGGIPMESN